MNPSAGAPPSLPLAWQHEPVRNGDAIAFLEQLQRDGLHPSLIYVDPPFGLGRTFYTASRRSGKRHAATHDPPAVAFRDRWPDGLQGYLDWMAELLRTIRDTLHPEGSLLLHGDHHAGPYLAILCDQLFGLGERGRGNQRREGFRNELIWTYGLGGSSPRAWPRKHDTILWYTRGTHWFFEPPRVPATSQRMRGQTKKHPDVIAIPALNNMARERTGWPTQKPVALLELLVRAHCPPGGLVVDPCCGSGTTLVAARHSGRLFAGADLAPEAVAITRRRLETQDTGQVSPP